MANTYTQISLHTIFSVQGRGNLISTSWREDLHRYIAGIIKEQGAKPLAVGGWNDHVHAFFGIQPTVAISDFVCIVKSSSAKWINENGFVRGKFRWQEGYGAFSYARSQRDGVIKYIMNQEEHHRTKTFQEEYIQMLKDFEVEYDEKYVFEFYE